MTLGEADGAGAGTGEDGAEGVAVLVLPGAGPAAGWAEGPAQPAARTASPAARAVSVLTPGPGHRLPVIGRPPLPDPRCWIPVLDSLPFPAGRSRWTRRAAASVPGAPRSRTPPPPPRGREGGGEGEKRRRGRRA